MTSTAEAHAGPRAGSRRRGTVVLAVLLGVVVMMAVFRAAWWWAHPNVIGDVNASMGKEPRPVASAAAVVNVTVPTDQARTTFTIRDLHAQLDENSAHATISWVICDIRPGAGPLFYTWTVDGLDRFCSDVRPVDLPMQITYPSNTEALLLVLTPTREGRVHLERVDLAESLGVKQMFRRGTDSIAYRVSLAAR